MSAPVVFYICPVCFDICETRRECHGHTMVHCDAVAPDDERRKPVFDTSGRLVSRAPRWFLEAVGWIRVGYVPGPTSDAG